MKLCNDCGNEISWERLEGYRVLGKGIPTLCKGCQESLEENGRMAKFRPPATAIAVLSEEDDSTRVVEEGWHRERLAI